MMRLLYTLVLCLGLAAPSLAQETYPNRTIRVVLPNVAGGVNDVVARIVVDHMTQAFGRPVIVENRAGAGSTIGADVVAKAPPDGYTLLVNGAAHAVIPALFKQSPVDPVKDFEMVALLARLPFVLAVSPGVPAKDLKELIALMKAQPGKLTFGSTGAGSAAHLASELFRDMAKVDFVHVPYRGTPAAVNDLLNGQISFMIDAQNLLAPQINAGAVRALAVTTPKRSTLLPLVPTFDEAGVPGYDTSAWQAMYAPKGTPRPIIDKLVAEVQAALSDPAVLKRFDDIGIEPLPGGTPESLGLYLQAEIDKWGPIIAATGATAN